MKRMNVPFADPPEQNKQRNQPKVVFPWNQSELVTEREAIDGDHDVDADENPYYFHGVFVREERLEIHPDSL
jgi:hypothetical protein